jgi:hypothetical protein
MMFAYFSGEVNSSLRQESFMSDKSWYSHWPRFSDLHAMGVNPVNFFERLNCGATGYRRQTCYLWSAWFRLPLQPCSNAIVYIIRDNELTGVTNVQWIEAHLYTGKCRIYSFGSLI